MCKDCHKTFSSVIGSFFYYTENDPYQWYLYIESLLNGDTIKKTASIVGISEYTSLVWRHKILSICVQMTDDDHILSDTVYIDEKLADVKYPGIIINKTDDSKIKRGISDQKRNIVCAIDIHNKKVIQVSERGRIHADILYEIYKDKIPSSCTVVSDSLKSYHKLMKNLKVKWIKIPSGRTEKDGYTLSKINDLHSSIDLFLYKYRGISDKYLKNYIGLYKFKDSHPSYYHKSELYKIFKLIVNSLCSLRFMDFNSDFKFSMI